MLCPPARRFHPPRGKGSHTIFFRDGVEEIVNIQPLGGKAKPYQVKQVRDLLLKYQFEID